MRVAKKDKAGSPLTEVTYEYDGLNGRDLL